MIAEEMWNPVIGCRKVVGCEECLIDPYVNHFYGGAKKNYMRPRAIRAAITEPSGRRRAHTFEIGVAGDIFQPEISTAHLDLIFDSIYANQNHYFILHTKRVAAAHEYLWRLEAAAGEPLGTLFPNLAFGVTVETNNTLRERLCDLSKIGITTKFIKVDPVLEAIDFSVASGTGITWVAMGEGIGITKRKEWSDSAISSSCESALSHGLAVTYFGGLQKYQHLSCLPGFVRPNQRAFDKKDAQRIAIKIQVDRLFKDADPKNFGVANRVLGMYSGEFAIGVLKNVQKIGHSVISRNGKTAYLLAILRKSAEITSGNPYASRSLITRIRMAQLGEIKYGDIER